MGAIYAGKYAGKRIKLDGKHKILYIQDRQEKIPLTNELIDDVKFKDGNSREYYRTFTVLWKDGDKSMLKVEKPYVDFLVSGVEVGEQEPQKGGLLAAIITFVIVLFIGFLIFGNNNNDSGNINSSNNYTNNIEYAFEVGSGERIVEEAVRPHVAEKYEASEITSLLIYDETDDETEDYSIMIDLSWSRLNKSEMAYNMLSTYSSDLAATVAKECLNVGKIYIYWDIPYLNENGNKTGFGKNYWIYERRGDNMYLQDENWVFEK